MTVLLILVFIGLVVFGVNRMQGGGGNSKRKEAEALADAQADARRWIERLGHNVLTMSGTDAASTQALADASERYNAASSAMSTAQTVKQVRLARESALEGLHYVNAAREIMGMPAGPALPPLEGQRAAGKVTETRTIEQNGETITASPVASDETPNYYPGGRVAGRPVPAGWYSTPWWAPALATGVWTAGSVMMFSSLFAGMSGVGYSGDAFASGYGNGYQDGLEAAGGEGAEGFDGGEGFEGGDAGDMGGMEDGGFYGFGDFGGGDFGNAFDFDFDF